MRSNLSADFMGSEDIYIAFLLSLIRLGFEVAVDYRAPHPRGLASCSPLTEASLVRLSLVCN